MQPFLRSASEGWALAVTSIRDLYAEADLHADEVGGDFAGEAERLGATTAEVHAMMREVLESRTADEAENAATAKQMHERLDAASEIVPQLAPYADGIRVAYDAVAALSPGVHVQRIHGAAYRHRLGAHRLRGRAGPSAGRTTRPHEPAA